MSRLIANSGIRISVSVMAVAAGGALLAFGTDTRPPGAVGLGAAAPSTARDAGRSPGDCNTNGIDDADDLLNCDGSPWCSDCNTNGMLDQCDIANTAHTYQIDDGVLAFTGGHPYPPPGGLG
jgi:hypothetical protein